MCSGLRPGKLNSIYPSIALKNKEFIITLYAPILFAFAFLLFIKKMTLDNEE